MIAILWLIAQPLLHVIYVILFLMGMMTYIMLVAASALLTWLFGVLKEFMDNWERTDGII